MLVVAEIFHLKKRLENVWIMLLGGAVEFLCPAIFIGNLFLIRMAAKEADLADSLLRWGKAAFVFEDEKQRFLLKKDKIGGYSKPIGPNLYLRTLPT